MAFSNPAHFRSAARLAWAVAAISLGACGSSQGGEDPNAIEVGLLLPFTGSSSATASNFERAVLYGVDRINAAGGISGRPVKLVSRDTHSDLGRSRQAADSFIADGARVVLGPESVDIALDLVPRFASSGVVFVSPFIGAGGDPSIDCTHPWFRIAPSAQTLGESLGKLLEAEHVGKVAILYAADSYDQALHAAVRNRFTTLGGTVAFEQELAPDAQSYSDSVTQTVAAQVDAVVLATAPKTGALVVNEFDAVSPNPPRFFLSPILKTEVFVQNVAADALEGSLGVTPNIYDTSDAFPAKFSERWQGDRPLEGSYFYYDAMALVALALTHADQAPADGGSFGLLESSLQDIAAPPGEGVTWNELESGLQSLAQGRDIYYSGLTGPMLFDGCGQRLRAVTTTWTVHDSAIVNIGP